MKKTYLNIALALTVAAVTFIGSTTVAQAKEQDLSWTVTYNGGESFSTTGEGANKSTIEDAMPGDTLTYNVTYANNATTAQDFYLSTSVLSSLEDNSINGGSSSATGGAYTYKITYTAPGKGAKTIFDSETIGGDNTAKEGLNQASGSNGSFVNVGTLAQGQSGVVTLTIKLDGNTQDNSYMATLAKLGFQFGTVEAGTDTGENKLIYKANEIVKNVTYKIPGGSEIVYIEDDAVALDGGNPQTGDSIIPLMICAIALLIGIGFIAWYFILTRREKEEVA